MESNDEASNEEFKLLSKEEFESLAEEEKQVYIKNNNINIRKLFDGVGYHIEEMKKILIKLKEIDEEKFE